MSHSVERNNLAGTVNMIVFPGPTSKNNEQLNKRATFTPNSVMVLDVAVCERASGDGKFKQISTPKTNVYSRTFRNQPLKLKASRNIINELQSKSKEQNHNNLMAFHIRTLSSETRKTCRAGLNECVKAGVLLPYDVFGDKNDASRTVRISCSVFLPGDGSSAVPLTKTPF